jgi:hypothetical protein
MISSSGDSSNAIHFCVNCANCGTNASRLSENYRCFAPANIAGADLVTGEQQLKQSCVAIRAELKLVSVLVCEWYREKEIEKPIQTYALPAPRRGSKVTADDL